jgi:hypothetical protein
LARLPVGVSLRGGVYQLRVGAPIDLQNAYGGVDAWRGSLRTSDRATAIRLAHAKIAEMHEDFERRRRAAKPARLPANPKLVDAVIAHMRHGVLEADDINRASAHPLAHIPLDLSDLNIERLSEDRLDRLDQVKEATALFAASLAELTAAGDHRMARGYAATTCEEMGLPEIDWTDQPVLLAKVARALASVYAEVAARAAGSIIETPEAPPAFRPVSEPSGDTNVEPTPATGVEGLSLRDVVPKWIARTRAKPNAIQRTHKALALFEEAVGVLPLSKLTKAVGAAFVEFLLDSPTRGFGDSTAFNHAAAINALVNVAVKVDLMKRNPFDLSFEVKGANTRSPWTTEELRKIYGASEFTSPSTVPAYRGVEPEDGAMVLRVLLFTGARVGEIAQMATSDVELRDGILALHVHDEHGTIKTSASRRHIPVARGLAEAGFAEFVEIRRAAGAQWLFEAHRIPRRLFGLSQPATATV